MWAAIPVSIKGMSLNAVLWALRSVLKFRSHTDLLPVMRKEMVLCDVLWIGLLECDQIPTLFQCQKFSILLYFNV